MTIRQSAALAMLVIVPAIAAARPQLNSSDMRRVLDIARSSDANRARFHAAYIFKLTNARLDYVEVEQIEVITELRRLELIGEEHARLNDTFGRGAFIDVEQALAPWRHRTVLLARVRFLPTTRFLTDVPPIHVIVADSPALPIDTRRQPIISGNGEESFLAGETIEEMYDAKALGTGSHLVTILWEGKELGRVTIDFGALK